VAYTYLSYPGVYQQNLGRLIRVAGWLPFWLLAAAAFYQIARSPAGKRHALLLAAAPTASGALSELIKLLVRRERPTAAAGAYLFRAFSDHPVDTGRFGMPSGDATVAFAAAWILTRVWPEAKFLWFSLAVGCALGRVLSRAHFLSDVTVAALLAVAVSEWLWRRYTSAGSSPLPTAT
jgi:membrane-associated phospholipid phosphatase